MNQKACKRLRKSLYKAFGKDAFRKVEYLVTEVKLWAPDGTSHPTGKVQVRLKAESTRFLYQTAKKLYKKRKGK